MRKFILISLLSATLGCSQEIGKNKDGPLTTTKTETKASEYPKIIDSLHIQKIFDDAKWRTYCINCTETCAFYPPKNSIITFGEAEIKVNEAELLNVDTIDITFAFFVDTQKCYPSGHYTPFSSLGMQYVISTGEPYAVIVYGSLEYFIINMKNRDKGNRYFEPLQSDVISYLNTNSAKLNPWFRSEAVKRGIIKNPIDSK